MLSKLKSSKSEKSTSGFTIIEVMIVLAIAGLILLIVFLAVPALQRNSRNTQRKNDVAGILGAASEFSTNNSGAPVSNAVAPTNTGGVYTFTAPANGAPAQAKVGYYNSGIAAAPNNVFLANSGTPIGVGVFINAAHDYVEIIPGDTCSGTAAVAGSSRSLAAIYEIESGGTYTQVCQGS